MQTPAQRLQIAMEILEGLSVGDAIGEALSYKFYLARDLADFSMFRPGTVAYTDDTEMATALVETLAKFEDFDEDIIAWAYTARFRRDSDRGYGKMARRILGEMLAGVSWREASQNAFSGGGSFGNGAAMRVAPLGGYFADDLARIPEMAARSARVTHAHPEGMAGAIAVAMAAGVAVASRGCTTEDAAQEIWHAVLANTPESVVRSRIEAARGMAGEKPAEVARRFGNGAEVSAQDTVPFCLWNACRNLADYREAILSTIEVGGDCDTNCAIVGGIVSAFAGKDVIPSDWQQAREALRLDRI